MPLTAHVGCTLESRFSFYVYNARPTYLYGVPLESKSCRGAVHPETIHFLNKLGARHLAGAISVHFLKEIQLLELPLPQSVTQLCRELPVVEVDAGKVDPERGGAGLPRGQHSRVTSRASQVSIPQPALFGGRQPAGTASSTRFSLAPRNAPSARQFSGIALFSAATSKLSSARRTSCAVDELARRACCRAARGGGRAVFLKRGCSSRAPVSSSASLSSLTAAENSRSRGELTTPVGSSCGGVASRVSP